MIHPKHLLRFLPPETELISLHASEQAAQSEQSRVLALHVEAQVYCLPSPQFDPMPWAVLIRASIDREKVWRCLYPLSALQSFSLIEQDYLREVLRTYVGSDQVKDKVCLGALGLAGESGEVVDMVKKHLFQGHPLDTAKLKDELGDVFWYLTLLCQANGFTLFEVIQGNIEKLRKRYPDGFDPERSRRRSKYEEEKTTL